MCLFDRFVNCCYFYVVVFFSAFHNVQPPFKKTRPKRNKDKKRTNVQKSLAVKWISGKRTIVYCRCTCHRHTLVFGNWKAWPTPIGARETSMAEQLVTKQDPNSCDRVGQKSHKFGGNVSELLKYCWLGHYIAIHAVDSEVKCGLKSNSVRSGQPTYEACDDNLDACT